MLFSDIYVLCRHFLFNRQISFPGDKLNISLNRGKDEDTIGDISRNSCIGLAPWSELPSSRHFTEQYADNIPKEHTPGRIQMRKVVRVEIIRMPINGADIIEIVGACSIQIN
jgi:hypothetical protein